MRTGRPRRARPVVNWGRSVSVEADTLSRRLQEELDCSANEIVERAIYALAEAQERRRAQTAAPGDTR
jgi:hypothetical protein